MGQALDQVSPQEMDMAKGNGGMVKDMVVKTVVKPFTSGGYDFDSSAYKIIDKVNTQSLPRDDMEFVQAILFLYKEHRDRVAISVRKRLYYRKDVQRDYACGENVTI